MSGAPAPGLIRNTAVPVVGLAAAGASAALVAEAGAPTHGSFPWLLFNGLLVLLPLAAASLLAVEPVAAAFRQRWTAARAAACTAFAGAVYMALLSPRAEAAPGPIEVVFLRYLAIFALPLLVGLAIAWKLGDGQPRASWVDVLFGAAIMILAGIKGNRMRMYVGARTDALFAVDASYFVWLLVLVVYVVLIRRLEVGYSLRAGRDDLAVAARVFAVLMAVLLPIGLLLGFIGLVPRGKPAAEIFFALTFYTLRVALAEELLFRALFQNALTGSLGRWLGEKRGETAGLLLGSLVFGLCHYRFGWDFTLLAALAGVGYSWAYVRTGRLTAPVLVHGLVDVVNFVFH